MQLKKLPLFPLQVVLFPHSALPLHIFEERYKVLINQCLEEGKEFGVNLIREEKVFDVGCTALVAAIQRRYKDGRMDIVVKGSRRYRLHSVDAEVAPYLVGGVSFLENITEQVDSSLASRTVRLYNSLVHLVYGDRVQQQKLQVDNSGLSFVLAQKAGMDLTQRQQLLELSSENERLQLLHSYFSEVVPKLRQHGEVDRVVKGDGYL